MSDPIIILGIDPGLRLTGFGVVEKSGDKIRYLGSGVIKTVSAKVDARDSLPERIQIILEGLFEVITPTQEFIQVKEALLKASLKIELAEVAMRPSLENALSGDDGIRMQKILDTLDDLDDVQEVYTTAVIED